MKTNIVLLSLLLYRVLRFFGGESEDQRFVEHTIAQKLSPKSLLTHGASGADLQRWLDGMM